MVMKSQNSSHINSHEKIFMDANLLFIVILRRYTFTICSFMMVSKTLAVCFLRMNGNDTRTSSRDIFAHDKPGNRRHTITDVWGISFVLS